MINVPVFIGATVDWEDLALTATNIEEFALAPAVDWVVFAHMVVLVVELVVAATQRHLHALAGFSAEEFVAWAVKVLLALAQAVTWIPVELGDRSKQVHLWAITDLAQAGARLGVEVESGRAFVNLIFAFAQASISVEHLEFIAD